MNGNNFITDQDINLKILSDENLVHIRIDNDDYLNYTCDNLWHENDGVHFIIREITSDEWLLREINAKLEYLAMMTEVDL